MHRCRIAEGSIVDRAILDKDIRVGKGARIGCGEVVPNRLHPQTLSSGVTVIGKGTSIPAGLRVGRGCVIFPDMGEPEFPLAGIPSGAVVRA